MSEGNNLFIGYADLEEWAKVVNKSRPIVVLPYVREEVSSHMPALSTQEYGVEAAQDDGQGRVHYCMVRSARVQLMFGKPPGEEGEQSIKMAREHQNLLLRWLTDQGFMLVSASYSMPKDYTRLRDHADSVATYDSEQQRYIPVQGGEV